MLKRKHITDINRARDALNDLGDDIAEKAYVTEDPEESYKLGKLDEVRDHAEEALANVLITAKTHDLGDVEDEDLANRKE